MDDERSVVPSMFYVLVSRRVAYLFRDKNVVYVLNTFTAYVRITQVFAPFLRI